LSPARAATAPTATIVEYRAFNPNSRRPVPLAPPRVAVSRSQSIYQLQIHGDALEGRQQRRDVATLNRLQMPKSTRLSSVSPWMVLVQTCVLQLWSWDQ